MEDNQVLIMGMLLKRKSIISILAVQDSIWLDIRQSVLWIGCQND
jgi:hypothetical protein